MSTVSGLSGFSSMFDPYLSAGQARFTVSSFEGSFASVSGVTSGIGSANSSSSASPVTVTETYAPEVSTDGGDSSTPVTVTDVSSPSVSSQDQSDMLQALIASQSRGDQVASADGGDFGVDDGQSANDVSAADASGALNAYSVNSSDFAPSTGAGVSAWA